MMLRECTFFNYEDEDDDEDDWSTLRRAAHCGRRLQAGTEDGPTLVLRYRYVVSYKLSAVSWYHLSSVICFLCPDT
jgi:hypothetical protein